MNFSIFLSNFFLQLLADQQQIILRGLLEENINDEDTAATAKAKMFYKSCMDIREFLELVEQNVENLVYFKESCFGRNS